MSLAFCARARKDTNVPQDDISALPLPTNPRTMMLLGTDPDKMTYHWEGPFGLPFETAPGQLYGPLRGWTRRGRYSGVLLSPEFRQAAAEAEDRRTGNEKFHLLDPRTEAWRAVKWDDRVFVLSDRHTGRDKMVIERNFLFTRRSNPAGSFEALMVKRSPYAIANFQMRGVNGFLRKE